MMTREKIDYIATLLYEAEKWRRTGGWGTLVMLIALLIDFWFRNIESASLIFESAIFGAFFCCWGSNFDRASRYRKELDNICYSLFGKSYDNSHIEIIELDKTKLY